MLLSHSPFGSRSALALLLIGASLVVGQQIFFGAEYAEKAAGPFGSEDAFRQHLVWWWLAVVPAVVAILMRRRWPLAAFLIAAGSALAHVVDLRLWFVGLPLMPIDLAVLITLGTLAGAARYRRTGLIALACAVATHVLVLLVALDNTIVSGRSVALLVAATRGGTLTPALNMTALPALLLCVAWALGDNIRTQRLRRAAVERHAADLQREQSSGRRWRWRPNGPGSRANCTTSLRTGCRSWSCRRRRQRRRCGPNPTQRPPRSATSSTPAERPSPRCGGCWAWCGTPPTPGRSWRRCRASARCRP
jgi:hypothetical protein